MRVICIGNSHVGAFSTAALADWNQDQPRRFDLYVARLDHQEYLPVVDPSGRINPVLARDIAAARAGQDLARMHLVGTGTDGGPDRMVVVSMVGGNAHNLLGLIEPAHPFDFILHEKPGLPLAEGVDHLPQAQVAAILHRAVQAEIVPILKALKAVAGSEIWHLESPPPIGDNDHVARHLEDRFRQAGKAPRVSPPAFRYKLWRLHSAAVRQACDDLGIRFVPHPGAAVDDKGFLLPDHVPANATHAAPSYGRLQLDQLEVLMETAQDAPRAPGDTPYRHLPESAFWTRSVTRLPADRVAPLDRFPFRIGPGDKVATAGSCFAQHISRHLRQGGYNAYVAEQPHPALNEILARDFGYGVFSARYANIYTSRQLLQLVQRAEGTFVPLTDVWEAPSQPEGGRGIVDPFRPAIQPGGYASVQEMRADRDRHLAAVRRMLREMDVFVFTLGLTETWIDRRDGAAFPLCPGIAGGRFDPAIHDFLNLSVDQVRDDLTRTIGLLRAIRPGLKVILTVSPVPLKATASGDHVMAATCYSKAVLRVAAHDIAAAHDGVGYFPSFEIITGNFNRGAYYADDLREIRPEGVGHVMRIFFDQVLEDVSRPLAPVPAVDLSANRIPASPQPATRPEPMAQGAARLECEEELLEFDHVMTARRTV